ncbi:MBL fold metallo-hydrolase [Bacillus sp. FJAT-45066]|uniref:MBL fold metallo-hydrolase n=1 Tax=Bacillus sp. FJAT-45066 TaxID=2011010 RepID=UPI000BB7C3E2|nr:MBL fold metallo-hydrolase [Bacillus sp. FJAT-45066]
MEWINVTGKVGYFKGSVNIGYARISDKTGLIFDAGLDDQTMKKVIKQLESLGAPITHLFISHAHADHYGGAAHLQKKYDVYTYAPVFEEAILRNPMLEPLYLFHGTYPMNEWRNKFIEGKPIRVDEVVSLEGDGVLQIDEIPVQVLSLPGHSYNQYGLIFDGIFFASDSYFSEETLEKHNIPYIVDGGATLATLHKLLTIECAGAFPGHGEYEENFNKTVKANIHFHEKVLEEITDIIFGNKVGMTLENLVENACKYRKIEIKSVPSFMLFRTAITAYVTLLISKDRVELIVKNNQLFVSPLA